jgi:APA family basic amino acid/polyamine antiporter
MVLFILTPNKKGKINNAKKIGFWGCTALVVGNMIGSGIFMLPATLAAFGGISIVGWICASIGAVLLAVVFGYLGKLAPEANGGPFAYTKLGMGDFSAYLVAWGYWVSIWCANAAITVAAVGYLAVFFPVLGESAIVSIVTGLGIIWFFTWINSKEIKTIALVQIITATLKVTPILLIGIWGICYVQLENFTPFNFSGKSDFSVITTTTMLTFFAFLGMESATIPSGSVKDSATTVRKATIFGTLATVVIYIISSVSIMGIIPAEVLAESSAPFADVAEIFWGGTAKYVVAAGAVIATMGALNGWILMQGAIPMAAAQAGLFPTIFGKVNKSNSPIYGIIISSFIVSIFMLFNYSNSLVETFSYMMQLTTLAVTIPFLFSIISFVIILKRSNSGYYQKLTVAIFAFLFTAWIMAGCGSEVLISGLLLFLLGIPIYFWITRE